MLIVRNRIVFKMYGILKLIIIGNRKFEIYSIENICNRHFWKSGHVG